LPGNDEHGDKIMGNYTARELAVILIIHLEKRLFEFAMTCIMLGEGVFLYFNPLSLRESSFRYALDTISAETFIILFFFFGIARIIAIMLNGHWMPWGAMLRMGGAFIGAMIWAQWCAALLVLNSKTGLPPSPGVVTYCVLALFEVVSMYRAYLGATKENARAQRNNRSPQLALGKTQ
jgi:hypothetical protein